MLLALFLSELSDAVRREVSSAPDLEAWLLDSVRGSREAFPELQLTPEDFVRHLARVVESLPVATSFPKLRTTDLYLAAACAQLDPRALGVFQESLFPVARRALARSKAAGSIVDDVMAGLRESLFFGVSGARPMILDYGGRGDLKSWVRSVVVHASLNALRREARSTGLEDAPELVDPGDPELVYLRSTYGQEFKAALRESMGALSDRERNVLRQRYLDGLNIDALGGLYGVHRATIARWIADACAMLLAGVRTSLARRLRLTESELDSVVRMGRSDFDVTLSSLLKNS